MATEQATTPKAAFETQACTRCGGSGSHSFNPRDLDRCYGCGGSGLKYTKRGLAAKAFYEDLLTTPVEEVEIGSAIVVRGKRLHVTGIKPYETTTAGSGQQPQIGIQTTRTLFIHQHGDTIKALHPDPTIQQARIDQAMTFQASLTKEGKSRKEAAR